MEKGIYGLLGVNGAGKDHINAYALYDCSTIRRTNNYGMDKNIWKLGGEYREVLGYLPQDFGYYPDLTVYDYMMYISSIKG